jgi:hypothetical protein
MYTNTFRVNFYTDLTFLFTLVHSCLRVVRCKMIPKLTESKWGYILDFDEEQAEAWNRVSTYKVYQYKDDYGVVFYVLLDRQAMLDLCVILDIPTLPYVCIIVCEM